MPGRRVFQSVHAEGEPRGPCERPVRRVLRTDAELGRLCACSCWIKKYVCPLCKVAFKKMPDRSKHKCVAKELAQGTASTTGRTHGQGKGPKKGEAKGKRIHQSATAKFIRMTKPTVAASNPFAESALPHIENYTFAEDVQAEATPQAYALDTPGSTPSSTACSSADTTAVNTPSDYNVADSAYSPSKFAPGAVPDVSLPFSATNSAFSSRRCAGGRRTGCCHRQCSSRA